MEPDAATLMMLALATAAGAAVQAATGFGFAILAAPVFLAVLGSTEAVPILIALHVGQSALIVPRVWAGVPWRHAAWLGLGAALGCPLGLLAFQSLDVRQLKLAAGLVILGVAGLVALRRRTPPPPSGTAVTGSRPLATFLTGTLSGALTALLVMPGPPLMVHLLRHPLPYEVARALSLTFFAACYVALLTLHMTADSMSRSAWGVVAWLLAPMLVGTIWGLRLARHLATRHFARVLNALLLLAGLGAIASAL